MAADDTNASSDDSQGPETRKLRSSEPDLKITVGEIDNTVVHWYHSPVMATHSHYIDTMLASPMKESETYEISFPDIEPKVWDLMMKFVSSQVANRDMMVVDVMLIATAYDQYDFATGLECCDRVLFEYFHKVYQTRYEEPSDLHLVIDAFLLADKAHLEEAKKKGIEYFKYVLDSDNYYGRCMFDKNHMKRLAQIIAGEKLLSNAKDEWTQEVILSPIFPAFFIRTAALHSARSELNSAVPRIKLFTSNSEANGVYHLKGGEFIFYRTASWGEMPARMRIKIRLGWNDCDDWVIVGYSEGGGDDKILWKCPFSANASIPPQRRWVPVDELARGTPTVEYGTDYSA